jgi:hypothetical protein
MAIARPWVVGEEGGGGCWHFFHLEDDSMIFTFCYINVRNVILVGAPATQIL